MFQTQCLDMLPVLQSSECEQEKEALCKSQALRREKGQERGALLTLGGCLGLSPCLLAEGGGYESSRGTGQRCPSTPSVARDPMQGAPGETASLT